MVYYNFQSQVLLGTVLGGSSLVKPPKGINYYLSMRSQNEKWLFYKMAEMNGYFSEMKLHKYGNTYRCNSCCHESITKLYEDLYNGPNRQIKMSILDTLTDTGIAMWFLDSGGKTGRGKKNAYINTTKFGEEGTKIILQYFNELDLNCNINHDGKRLKILFSVTGTESLFKIIAHRFPTFMYDRI
jgi:hypothetical protein